VRANVFIYQVRVRDGNLISFYHYFGAVPVECCFAPPPGSKPRPGSLICGESRKILPEISSVHHLFPTIEYRWGTDGSPFAYE